MQSSSSPIELETPPWLAHLPDWVTSLRPGQFETAMDIANDFRSGNRFVIADAPTGSGKTLIAEMVRRELGVSGLYVCTTKSLQEQVRRDFPYARVIKGRANYPPRFLDATNVELTCDDCSRHDAGFCSLCFLPGDPINPKQDGYVEYCPYVLAKRAALDASLAIANTSYFLREANMEKPPNNVGDFSSRELVIIDEADCLEDELMDIAHISISPRRQKRYGITAPAKITVKEAWVQWAWRTAAHLETVIKREAKRAGQLPVSQMVKAKKQVRDLRALWMKLNKLAKDQGENWVYDPADDGTIVFKPITVGEYGPRMVWRHGQHFLLMSGTVIEPNTLADSIGIPPEQMTFHQMDYGFPIENRPVYVRPVANMSYKNKAEAVPKAAAEVANIVAERPGKRILVHSVSYELGKAITAALEPQGRTVTYSGAKDRQDALERYIDTPGAVLVAPSFERGVDLRGDLCEVIIIAKVPFPHLGDKQVAARLYRGLTGNLWYQVKTIRSLVQMMGRGMRSADDRCEVFILDEQFVSNVWKKSRRLLPHYIIRAINWTGGK